MKLAWLCLTVLNQVRFWRLWPACTCSQKMHPCHSLTRFCSARRTQRLRRYRACLCIAVICVCWLKETKDLWILKNLFVCFSCGHGFSYIHLIGLQAFCFWSLLMLLMLVVSCSRICECVCACLYMKLSKILVCCVVCAFVVMCASVHLVCVCLCVYLCVCMHVCCLTHLLSSFLQVEMFLRRAFCATSSQMGKIHCLAFADSLDYDVGEQA